MNYFYSYFNSPEKHPNEKNDNAPLGVKENQDVEEVIEIEEFVYVPEEPEAINIDPTSAETINQILEGDFEQLFNAVMENNEDILFQLLLLEEEKKTTLFKTISTKTIHNQTILHIAAVFASFEWTKFLIKTMKTAKILENEINYQDINGMSPLHHVSRTRDSEDILQLLMQNGGNVNLKDVEGKNILHNIIENDFNQSFNFLIGLYHKNKNSPTNNNTTATNKNNNIEISDEERLRQKMVKMFQGNYKMTDSERHNIRVCDQDNSGDCAIHYACLRANDRFLTKLLDILCSENEENRISNESPEEKLYRSSLINMKNKKGQTPLHYTFRSLSIKCTQLLWQFYNEKTAFKSSIHGHLFDNSSSDDEDDEEEDDEYEDADDGTQFAVDNGGVENINQLDIKNMSEESAGSNDNTNHNYDINISREDDDSDCIEISELDLSILDNLIIDDAKIQRNNVNNNNNNNNENENYKQERDDFNNQGADSVNLKSGTNVTVEHNISTDNNQEIANSELNVENKQTEPTLKVVVRKSSIGEDNRDPPPLSDDNIIELIEIDIEDDNNSTGDDASTSYNSLNFNIEELKYEIEEFDQITTNNNNSNNNNDDDEERKLNHKSDDLSNDDDQQREFHNCVYIMQDNDGYSPIHYTLFDYGDYASAGILVSNHLTSQTTQFLRYLMENQQMSKYISSIYDHQRRPLFHISVLYQNFDIFTFICKRFINFLRSQNVPRLQCYLSLYSLFNQTDEFKNTILNYSLYRINREYTKLLQAKSSLSPLQNHATYSPSLSSITNTSYIVFSDYCPSPSPPITLSNSPPIFDTSVTNTITSSLSTSISISSSVTSSLASSLTSLPSLPSSSSLSNSLPSFSSLTSSLTSSISSSLSSSFSSLSSLTSTQSPENPSPSPTSLSSSSPNPPLRPSSPPYPSPTSPIDPLPTQTPAPPSVSSSSPPNTSNDNSNLSSNSSSSSSSLPSSQSMFNSSNISEEKMEMDYSVTLLQLNLSFQNSLKTFDWIFNFYLNYSPCLSDDLSHCNYQMKNYFHYAVLFNLPHCCKRFISQLISFPNFFQLLDNIYITLGKVGSVEIYEILKKEIADSVNKELICQRNTSGRNVFQLLAANGFASLLEVMLTDYPHFWSLHSSSMYSSNHAITLLAADHDTTSHYQPNIQTDDNNIINVGDHQSVSNDYNITFSSEYTKDGGNTKTPTLTSPLADLQGNDIFFYALYHKRFDCIEMMLKKYPSLLFSINHLHRNIFHVVAASGNVHLCELLLSRKDTVLLVDQRDLQGMSPIMLGCYHGHFEFVKSFIHLVDKFQSNVVDNCTLLHYACFSGNLALIQFIIFSIQHSPQFEEMLHKSSNFGTAIQIAKKRRDSDNILFLSSLVNVGSGGIGAMNNSFCI